MPIRTEDKTMRKAALSGTALALLLLGSPALAQNTPAETAAPNAPNQEPAFPEQTRAPQPEEATAVTAEVVADGLPHLWAMEFLPDGRMLVTAKAGAMHVIDENGTAGPAISGLPEVDNRGQGGLLDVALASDFAETNRIFFSYAEPREGGNGTALATAILNLDDANGGALEAVEVIFRQEPTYDGDKHFGSRIVPLGDGTLYLTVGERSDAPVRSQAQELASGFGKVFHIDYAGNAVDTNPFAATDGALPEIWSLGHRNVQSATLDGDGRLWIVEHGARGGDELNRPEAGLNYGWPDIAYGVEYSGAAIGEGITADAETEQPVYYWDPVIAPSGMAYYDADAIPQWTGAFIIGGLISTGLVVVHVEDNRVVTEERVPLDARIRDVRVGPDGAVYAVTETRGGGNSSILRITAAN
jgi:glucose/arabinose dehydrogenase